MRIVRAIGRAPFAARTRRELAYLLATILPAIPPFVLALMVLVSTALSLFAVGLPLLALSLIVARRAPAYFRGPAGAILGWSWPDPQPLSAPTRRGRLVEVLRDRTAWRAALYCGIKLPLTAAVSYVAAALTIASALALTSPAWWLLGHHALGGLSPATWRQAWLLAPQGAVTLLALPWFVRLAVALDRTLARALLAPSRDQERISVLERRRATLTQDADATLRRIERDLHDGTQARLVAVGLTLSRLEHRELPAEQRALVVAARSQVSEGLAELRTIVRGIHPPALNDGLATALGTLVARSSVPIEYRYELRDEPPPALAGTLYFAASELLANIARHANARSAGVALRETSAGVSLCVYDDGGGGAEAGADPAAGTGLVGLRRRAEALDGTLRIHSPRGGPTTISVTIPRQ